MKSMFKNASNFNQSIIFWLVSIVTNMESMFESATSFNYDISKWRVLNVVNMNKMFKGASNFHHTIQYWLLTPTAGVPTFENILQLNYLNTKPEYGFIDLILSSIPTF